MNVDMIEHEVINQFESDFQEQEYDAMSEMLQILIKKEESRNVLLNYLSDSAQKTLKEGKTIKRY